MWSATSWLYILPYISNYQDGMTIYSALQGLNFMRLAIMQLWSKIAYTSNDTAPLKAQCTLTTKSNSTFDFVDFDNVAHLSLIVESRLSSARSTLLNKRRTTTYMNIYEPRDDPVTGDVVSTLSLVRTNWRQSYINQTIQFVNIMLLCPRWL